MIKNAEIYLSTPLMHLTISTTYPVRSRIRKLLLTLSPPSIHHPNPFSQQLAVSLDDRRSWRMRQAATARTVYGFRSVLGLLRPFPKLSLPSSIPSNPMNSISQPFQEHRFILFHLSALISFHCQLRYPVSTAKN